MSEQSQFAGDAQGDQESMMDVVTVMSRTGFIRYSLSFTVFTTAVSVSWSQKLPYLG